MSIKEVEDLKITPELQAKLDRYRAFSDYPVFFWTPPLIRKYMPKEKWPVFKLESRTGLDFIKAEDEMGYRTVNGFTYTCSGEVKLNRLKKKCLGWKNWPDGKGGFVEYKADENGVLDELIDRMGVELQEELYAAISGDDKLTKEELQGLEF